MKNGLFFVHSPCLSCSIRIFDEFIPIPICSMVLEYLPTFARTKSPKCSYIYQHHGSHLGYAYIPYISIYFHYMNYICLYSIICHYHIISILWFTSYAYIPLYASKSPLSWTISHSWWTHDFSPWKVPSLPRSWSRPPQRWQRLHQRLHQRWHRRSLANGMFTLVMTEDPKHFWDTSDFDAVFMLFILGGHFGNIDKLWKQGIILRFSLVLSRDTPIDCIEMH